MPRDLKFDYDNVRFSYRVAAVPVRDGKILLQRPAGTREYAFIGGHVAFGETAAETLRRELQEELHADATIGELTAVGEIWFPWKKPCHQIALYFRVELDMAALPEGDCFCGFDEDGEARYNLEFVWLPLDKLTEIEVYPPQLARHILSGKGDVAHFTYNQLPADTRWPE